MKPYALNVNDLNSTEEPSAQWTRRAVGLSLLGTLAACGSSTNTVISSGTSSSSGPVVSTFAGSGVVGSADGAGILASFRDPTGVAVDSNGNVYVAEPWNCLIRKISPSGVVTTLAGVGSTSGHTDGNGPQALFSGPSGLAVDSSGTVYVADTWNNLIRKITPGGEVTTWAGSVQGYADGTGANASFFGPSGLAVDSNGNVYVADAWNHLIRKITSGGVVSLLAGLVDSTAVPPQGVGGSSNGTGTNASFNNPNGVAMDSSGNIYVADTWNSMIRKITISGGVATVTTLAGNGTPNSHNGTGTNASFNSPNGLAVDGSGNVYVADTGNHLIRKITPSGVVTTLAGTARVGGYEDGIGTQASFSGPTGLAIDRSGNLYVADPGNHVIRKITL